MTVLSVHLVGFTSHAEQMDPEDVRAVLSPYYARLRAEQERFGGTMEKFIGDAVMALFGAPVSHEDDPERTVRAALAIRDWVQDEQIQIWLAVNTSEALITLGSRPADGEGMATGDLVNTAARLQAAAPVNGILVCERTFRATRWVIEYREVSPVTAKGKREPVAAWEVLQARARSGVDVPHQARTARRWLSAGIDSPWLLPPGPWPTRTSCELPNPSTPWERRGRAQARFWAAQALCKAGRTGEAGTQFQSAFDFYRSGGATRFINGGAPLLAALLCRSMTA